MKKRDYLDQKRQSTALQILGIFVVYVAFSVLLNFNTFVAVFNMPRGVYGFFTDFFPTIDAFADLPRIGWQLWKTFLVSVSSTFIAMISAFMLALLGSKNMSSSKVVRVIIRVFGLVTRNIPIVAWAMVLLLTFKQSEFTGFLALYISTVGLLLRAFIEIIDTSSTDTLEAMDVVGANYWHKVCCCVFPIILPQIISWTLYMIETNLRSATLVGILTGTGIGFLFELYFKSMRYDFAGLTVWAIVVVVICIEKLSNYLRKELI